MTSSASEHMWTVCKSDFFKHASLCDFLEEGTICSKNQTETGKHIGLASDENGSGLQYKQGILEQLFTPESTSHEKGWCNNKALGFSLAAEALNPLFVDD